MNVVLLQFLHNSKHSCMVAIDENSSRESYMYKTTMREQGELSHKYSNQSDWASSKMWAKTREAKTKSNSTKEDAVKLMPRLHSKIKYSIHQGEKKGGHPLLWSVIVILPSFLKFCDFALYYSQVNAILPLVKGQIRKDQGRDACCTSKHGQE